jgi:hypothetical protein
MAQVKLGGIYFVFVLGVVGRLPPEALSAEVILGSTNDSMVNSAPAIQAALDAVEARGGGVVRLTGGVYHIGDGALTGKQGLKIGNNTHLHLDDDAVIIRNFAHGGDEGATIRNKCQVAGDCLGGVIGNEHIRVSGGTIKTVNPDFDGHHFGFLHVDWLTISDMRFLGVEHWNVSLRSVNDAIISNLSMDSGTELHSAGVQVTGGSRIVIADCNIRCGDDSIALVVDTFEGTGNISDVVISNCYLHSRQANALRMIVEGAHEGTSTISRVAVSNIVAKAGVQGAPQSGGITIRDEKELQLITNVEINGFHLDASETPTEPLVVEGVTGLRLARVVIRGAHQRARIAGSHDVALIDCTIAHDTEPPSGQQCLLIAEPAGNPPVPVDASCSNIRIVGGEYRDAGQHAIQIGSNMSSVDFFEISNAQIVDALANGIMIANASNGRVIGNRISGCDGLGIQELGTSNNNLILGNWLYGNMGNDISVLGAETQVVRNWAEPGAELPDSGGFRQTIDGWTFPPMIQNGGSVPLTEMTRPNGRFRAVRPGSVTGLVVTLSEPRTGGTMTVSAYKNSGDADAPAPGTDMLFSVTISTNVNRQHLAKPSDASPTFTFDVGDELYLMITTDTWAVATGPTKVFCALEIED